MNVLMLGGAKRVSMARMIVSAAKARGEQCTLYSYETGTHVPIAAVAKVIVGLRWSDPAIYDHLWQIVRDRDIKVIIPFVDGAVSIAAEMMRRHSGEIFAPTCSPEQAEEMFDKQRAAAVFERESLPIPATYTGVAGDRPLIAKPRHGSASKGIVTVNSAERLADVLAHAEDYLIQERIDRREEFTVDCYVSVRTGRILTVVPRLRIEVSGGEVTHTATLIRPQVFDLAKLALERLGLRGAVTIQVLHDLDTDRYMIMEINPRLGGGAVCAVRAGADIPALIFADAAGEDPEFLCYRPNTEIVRYPQEITFFN